MNNNNKRNCKKSWSWLSLVYSINFNTGTFKSRLWKNTNVDLTEIAKVLLSLKRWRVSFYYNKEGEAVILHLRLNNFGNIWIHQDGKIHGRLRMRYDNARRFLFLLYWVLKKVIR